MADRHGQRQRKSWTGFSATSLDFTADATQVGSSVGFLETGTILRMIGQYTIGPVTAPVALESMQLTVALGIFSTDAVTLGSTAMPDPTEEPEYPWLYWKSHPLFFGTTSLDPATQTGSARVDFDIRSMRKFKARESLAWVVQGVRISGTADLRIVMGHTRVLIGQ